MTFTHSTCSMQHKIINSVKNKQTCACISKFIQNKSFLCSMTSQVYIQKEALVIYEKNTELIINNRNFAAVLGWKFILLSQWNSST